MSSLLWSISRHLVLEQALNILVKSKRTRAREGGESLVVVVMYLSICCCVRWAVKSTPPLVFMPYCPC